MLGASGCVLGLSRALQAVPDLLAPRTEWSVQSPSPARLCQWDRQVTWGQAGGAGEDWGWAGCLCPSTASWTGHRRDRSTPAPRPSRAWVAQPPLSPGVPAGCPRPGGCGRYGASPGHSGEPPGLGGRHGGAGEQPEAALLGSEGGEGAAGGAEGRQIPGRRSPPTLVSLQPGITGLGAGGWGPGGPPGTALCRAPFSS